MGLPTEILKYFSMNIEGNLTHNFKTIGEFVKQPEYENSGNFLTIMQIIQKFKLEGYLVSVGFKAYMTGRIDFENEQLVCWNFEQDYAEYGEYDFLVLGFSHVAAHFTNSVVPIVVKDEVGDLDVGTGFLLYNTRYLVTARHVIENKKLVQIQNNDGLYAEAEYVIYSTNEDLDVAIIVLKNDLFDGYPPFQLREAVVLEDVMTIGYPPLMHFDAFQIYETASVNNLFKFSKGQIIAKNRAFRENIEYLIINAKVKGGNSGSPVINRNGTVIGISVKMLMDNHGKNDDPLGYGIVTPATELSKYFNTTTEEFPTVKIPVTNVEHGFIINKHNWPDRNF